MIKRRKRWGCPWLGWREHFHT